MNIDTFIQALEGLETRNELDALVALYADDARIANVLMPQAAEGRAGAESFWRLYRDSFKTVKSRFESVIIDGDQASLEWVSTGTSVTDQPFEYRGVSILEYEGDEIVRFNAYFDSEALYTSLGQERPAAATA